MLKHTFIAAYFFSYILTSVGAELPRASSSSLGALMISLLVLAAMAANSVHAISCVQALLELMPCRPFLTGGAASPSAPCCMAVTHVNAAASTTKIRRELCKCFKENAPRLGVDPEKAKQLPQLCHVHLPVPIDPSVNCNTIPDQE